MVVDGVPLSTTFPHTLSLADSTLSISIETSMLSAKATRVNLRLPMQWQREVRIGSLLQEMRLRPQRQEDQGIAKYCSY
jgi:hypothetical protein